MADAAEDAKFEQQLEEEEACSLALLY